MVEEGAGYGGFRARDQQRVPDDGGLQVQVGSGIMVMVDGAASEFGRVRRPLHGQTRDGVGEGTESGIEGVTGREGRGRNAGLGANP